MSERTVEDAFFSFDELVGAVVSLEVAATTLEHTEHDPTYWGWVIVATHSALQALMVCNLTAHGNRLSVIRHPDKWEKAWRNGDELPDDWLLSFMKLYKRTKNSDYMSMTYDAIPLPSSPEWDEAVSRLNKWRNKFIHFLPTDWTIERLYFADTVVCCAEVMRFLAFETKKLQWNTKEDLQERAEKALAFLLEFGR